MVTTVTSWFGVHTTAAQTWTRPSPATAPCATERWSGRSDLIRLLSSARAMQGKRQRSTQLKKQRPPDSDNTNTKKVGCPQQGAQFPYVCLEVFVPLPMCSLVCISVCLYASRGRRSVCSSACRAICRSAYIECVFLSLSVHLMFCDDACLPICLFACLCGCILVDQSVCSAVGVFVCVCLSTCLSACRTVPMSACRSV